MQPLIRKRKAYMTLLEALIAISLLSMLLVFVFGFFREMSVITRATDHSQKQSFQMRYVESRLGFIFERIVNENEKSRNFFFYTQPPAPPLFLTTSLIVTFNNEVRLDPTFSGDVLARLYVDAEKRLRLAIWPLHVSDPYQHLQEEILMENVVDIIYSFYSAPEKKIDKHDIVNEENIDPEKKSPPKNQWLPEWYITYDQMPSMMTMTITVEADAGPSLEKNKEKEKEKIKTYIFHFVLPSSKNYVHYPAGDLSS